MRYSTTVGVDLAKNAIQVSVVSPRGKELLNRSFTRRKFAEFLGKRKPSLVAFESCASAHYWARAASRDGHEARIIPAKAEAPFRQGHKTDSNDALAVAEAARRPNIKEAPMKTAEQQGLQAIHSFSLWRSLREPSLLELLDHVDHRRVHRFKKRSRINTDAKNRDSQRYHRGHFTEVQVG